MRFSSNPVAALKDDETKRTDVLFTVGRRRAIIKL